MFAACLALLVAQPPGPPEPPPALPEEVLLALQAGEELERRRAWAAAASQVEGILPLVGGELRSELRLRVCHLRRGGGAGEVARRCYGALAGDAGAGDESRSLARYHAALLEADPAAARAAMRAAVLLTPDSTGGLRALAWLRGERRPAGLHAEADLLLGVASELARQGRARGSTRYAEALTEAGRLRLEAGDAARAAATLQTARAAAEGTVWSDDALYGSARAARALRRWDEAMAFYEQLIAARQVSFFVGSYDSEHFDAALLEVGDLLEGLGRKEAARQAYERLADEAPRSRLVDDAAFGLARLEGTPQAFADFVTRYPESRHRPAAAARAAPKSPP